MARLNLTIDQGSSFSNEFTVQQDDGTPVDLTGYLVKSEMRKTFRSSAVIATFVTALLDAVNGKITMNLSATLTTAIKSGRYVWDFEITSPGTIDEITAINVGNGGSGYTAAPTVNIIGGGGTGAVATANLTSGIVTSITVNNVGSGYTSDPLITLTGGGGTGATAESVRGARVQRILEGVITVTPEVTKI